MGDFDIDVDEIREANESFKIEPRSLDRRICICGHAMSRHHVNGITGEHYCKPGQLSCPCIQERPVVEVPNTRPFMRKSRGSGAKHALVLGFAGAEERLGEEFTSKRTWLIEEKCDICKEPFSENEKFFPVRVTTDGIPISDYDDDTGVTAFMCRECRST
jgi:hypothetical protein